MNRRKYVVITVIMAVFLVLTGFGKKESISEIDTENGTIRIQKMSMGSEMIQNISKERAFTVNNSSGEKNVGKFSILVNHPSEDVDIIEPDALNIAKEFRAVKGVEFIFSIIDTTQKHTKNTFYEVSSAKGLCTTSIKSKEVDSELVYYVCVSPELAGTDKLTLYLKSEDNKVLAETETEITIFEPKLLLSEEQIDIKEDKSVDISIETPDVESFPFDVYIQYEYDKDISCKFDSTQTSKNYHKMNVRRSDECDVSKGKAEILFYLKKQDDDSVLAEKKLDVMLAAYKSIENTDIVLNQYSYVYDGKTKEPTVSVTFHGDTLIEKQDYMVSYESNVEAGDARCIITGMGNFTGNKSVEFSIIPKSIQETVVTLAEVSYIYDGKAKTPEVTVKDGTVLLSQGKDYFVSYVNNSQEGTAFAVVEGKGNYTGKKETAFSILSQESVTAFEWNRDNWNFNNSSDDPKKYFSNSRYIDQINEQYVDVLKKNLTNSEYKTVFVGDSNNGAWIYDEWRGSCHGMSSLCLLAKHGMFPYSDYKAGATCLNQLSYPIVDEKVSSVITYYQMSQVKDVIRQEFRRTLIRSNEENIKEILKLLDVNSVVLLGFQKEEFGGHTVLAYGYEYGSYTIKGVSYQGRIKICDPNSSIAYNEWCHIYFNTKTYNWEIPGYSSYKISSVEGAKFNLVEADLNKINEGGYLSGTTNEKVENCIARIDAEEVSENRSCEKVKGKNGNYVTQNFSLDDIVEEYSYILGGKSKGTAGYNLRDAKSAYKLSQNNAERLQASIDYEKCDLGGGSLAGHSIVFDKEGYVAVEGESADYNLSMVFDEDYPMDWFSIVVNGSGADEASLMKTDNGYILESDNLKKVEVKAYNRNESVNMMFGTEYPTVFIYETEGKTLGAKVDTDNNGTYETVLESTHIHKYGEEWKWDSQKHWKDCGCGEKVEIGAHTFRWVVDEAATEEKTGLKHEECSVCGYKRNEKTVIAKLPSTGIKTNSSQGTKTEDARIKKIKKSKTTITKLKAGKKQLSVKFKKISIKGIKYQIQVKRSGGTWKTYTVSGTSKTIKKLKKKTKYSVRVRAVLKLSGKMYYGKWSGVKKKKTN